MQSYHKIINLQRDIPKRLESNKDPMKILSTCIHRIEFRKIEEDQQRDIDREYERQQFNAIDWNDFQIVETIDIPELELENSNPQKKTVAPPVVVPAPIPIPVAIPVYYDVSYLGNSSNAPICSAIYCSVRLVIIKLDLFISQYSQLCNHLQIYSPNQDLINHRN